MHTLLTNLMAVLLVVHAALGCCWRHAHCREQAAQACETAACCEESHSCRDDAGRHEHTPPCPCNGQAECRGVCTYVAPQKVQLDSEFASAPFDYAAPGPVLADVRGTFSSLGEITRTPDLGPPLRLHLLHQIVLI